MLNLEFTGDIGHVTFTLASTRNVDISRDQVHTKQYCTWVWYDHTEQQSLASEALVLGFPHCAMINQVLSAALEPSNVLQCYVVQPQLPGECLMPRPVSDVWWGLNSSYSQLKGQQTDITTKVCERQPLNVIEKVIVMQLSLYVYYLNEAKVVASKYEYEE